MVVEQQVDRDAAEPAVVGRLAPRARPIIWAEGTDRIQEVAQRIGAGGHSCALVRTPTGLGIVTDHDFRRRVATGEVGVDAPVSALATVPVLTIDGDASEGAGLLAMIEHAVHHLVVTDPAGEPIGVLRAVDLAQAEVRDPLLVRAAIAAATTMPDLAAATQRLPATLVALRARRVDPLQIGAVYAAMLTAVLRRVLQLEPDPAPGSVPRSWVVLGSLARREALPRSDIDTALVWADPAAPADRLRAGAGAVLAQLRRCGLEPCPNGTNADQPRFSRSRAAWTAAIQAWRRDPGQDRALLMSAILADSFPVTEPELGRCLTEPIFEPTGNTRFLRALLDEALRFRPPTGLVRDFVIEHHGEHRGQLDLKRGGLAPVTGLARWTAIATGDPTGNTVQRLHRGAAQGLLTADEAATLAGAFEDIYALVLDHEIAALSAGATPSTYVAPRALDTLTRRHLRESFRVIRTIQARLDTHWLARLERTPSPPI